MPYSSRIWIWHGMKVKQGMTPIERHGMEVKQGMTPIERHDMKVKQGMTPTENVDLAWHESAAGHDPNRERGFGMA
ncbi:hypothetical protein GPALN_003393 [Globodera pallida]|nr:hypothetical protein GPALN_003393 [Globodera pallida]